jgi:peptidoglycan/LPS O-acetylase OafA/YrhL
MFLRAPAMTYLGTRSYGLYLFHFLIFEKLEPLRRPHSLGNFLLVTVLRFAITFLVVELSFRFIEKPFLNLKRRFEQDGVADRSPSLVGDHLKT